MRGLVIMFQAGHPPVYSNWYIFGVKIWEYDALSYLFLVFFYLFCVTAFLNVWLFLLKTNCESLNLSGTLNFWVNLLKGRIRCEIFLSGHFMKYSFRVISWNTFTSVSNIHRVMFLINKKNCKRYREKISEKISCKI